MVALKRAFWFSRFRLAERKLTSESVKGASLAFQSVDDIHCGDGLSLGVLTVCDSITDDIFQENFENSTGFLVDETRDTFHTTTTSKTADSWLSDSLDVITKNLAVTLGTPFSKTFASFTTSRHFFRLLLIELC